MIDILNLFPARAAIGRVILDDGTQLDVLMTPEFSRALARLMTRVGGPVAMSLDDVTTLTATDSTASAMVPSLQSEMADIKTQAALASQFVSQFAALERRIEDLSRIVHSVISPQTDWEHPGKLGDKTPNTARVTTLNRITFTQPTTQATFTLTDGKTFTVSNTLTLTATDGATLNIGSGGTLKSAAYQDVTAFAARTNMALGPAATDAASTQTLANNMRSALLAVGIGT